MGPRPHDLQPIHPAVEVPGLGPRKDHRHRDEALRVIRPSLEDRQIREVDLVAAENDLLAWPAPHDLRQHLPEVEEHRQLLELVEEGLRGLLVEDRRETVGDLLDVVDTASELDAPQTPECVAQDRHLGTLDVLEEERRADRLADSIRDLANLELGVDLDRNAAKFAFGFESGDEVAEVLVGHRRQLWHFTPPRARALATDSLAPEPLLAAI